ncbi:MAG TPA: MBL fold metallo-hydrolase [Anaerolineaceae bacterium]|nr:MBL fold metallo-hydrolase [Anaerolineaceae bacterium]
MGQIDILGTAYAVPDQQHENTHLMVVEGEHHVLIDCASNPIQHLRQARVVFDEISDLILTHFHPDHVSGAPLLLMDMWLLGRKLPLNIYGLDHTIDRMEAMMDLFEWKRWPGFFPVLFHRIPEQEMSPVLDFPDLRLYTSPVKHLIPTIGLRVEFPHRNKVVAYSCDTEPCPQVVRLAESADILIHEVAGASLGHSSPAQAAEIAQRANAGSLYLIHYPTRGVDLDSLVEEARLHYPGPVTLAKDFMSLEID